MPGSQGLEILTGGGCPDEPAPGIPDKNTLERLVCASLAAAYPDRAGDVGAWLTSRSRPPPACPKEHAWSYMAGSYAEQGCESFLRFLWSDAPVARELESRMRANGAWAVVERILQ